MTESAVLNVEISLTEDPDRTLADAWVTIGDRRCHGHGKARRNPHDPDIPRIGEELATARALSDLAHELVDAAAGDIERYEGRDVTLRI